MLYNSLKVVRKIKKKKIHFRVKIFLKTREKALPIKAVSLTVMTKCMHDKISSENKLTQEVSFPETTAKCLP